jgi:hypothetical protein
VDQPREVGAHAPVSLGGEGLQPGNQLPFLLKTFLRPPSALPRIQQFRVDRVGGGVRNGDLVRPPRLIVSDNHFLPSVNLQLLSTTIPGVQTGPLLNWREAEGSND